MPNEIPLSSQGPDRFHGAYQCLDHFLGQRTDIVDWCCCCQPCLYIRPLIPGAYTCRCYPQLICFNFTPDEGQPICCSPIHMPIVPTYSAGPPDVVSYTLQVAAGTFLSLRVTEGYWKLFLNDVELSSVAIDHTVITCLDIPNIELANFNYGGCVGTFSFTPSDLVTLPFANRQLLEVVVEDQEIIDNTGIWPENSPCECAYATRILCVSGIRHVGGEEEFVEFIWNNDLGERWEYLPPGGDITNELEIIYLRGDYYGNCWLEFDFERTGTTTNDWADPPNTFDGNDIYNIRPGMLEIDTCVCGLRTRTSTTGRSIRIHAGPCSRFKYRCGTCRCMPRTLCLIGSIEGVGDNFSAVAVWDGGGWDAGYFRLVLVEDEATECVFRLDSSLDIYLENSNPITCGNFVAAEMYADYDNLGNPGLTNWLWIGSPVCGNCGVTFCGLCADQCGGPPDILFVNLQAQNLASVDPDDPYDEPDRCDLTVVVQYWQRWDTTTIATPACGYIGYSEPITCDGYNIFRIRVELFNFGINIKVRREYLSGPVFDEFGPLGDEDPGWFDQSYTFDVAEECDPYYREGSWIGQSDPRCMWGCSFIDQVRVIIYD